MPAKYNTQSMPENSSEIESKENEARPPVETPVTFGDGDQQSLFSTEVPQKTNDTDQYELLIQGIIQDIEQEKENQNLVKLKGIYDYVLLNGYNDPRIYNTLMSAYFFLNQPQQAQQVYTSAINQQALNLATFHILIFYENNTENILQYYTYLVSNKCANEETYVAVLRALARRGELVRVDGIYRTQVPLAVKENNLEIHEIVISMALCHYSNPLKEAIKMFTMLANAGYHGALKVMNNHPEIYGMSSYDKFHAMILEVALVYHVCDEYADGIYEHARNTKTSGPLTEAAYNKCVKQQSPDYIKQKQAAALAQKASQPQDSRQPISNERKPQPYGVMFRPPLPGQALRPAQPSGERSMQQASWRSSEPRNNSSSRNQQPSSTTNTEGQNQEQADRLKYLPNAGRGRGGH